MTATPARRITPHRAACVVATIAGLVLLGGCTDLSPKTLPPKNASTPCAAQVECESPTVREGVTTLQVTAEPSESDQIVYVALDYNDTLACEVKSEIGGALAVFTNTGPDAAKTVTYTLSGTAGERAIAAHKRHPHYLGCYASPQPFTGFNGKKAAPAPFNREDLTYQAALLACDNVTTTPCFHYAASKGKVTITIDAPAGDPKFI